MINCTLLSARGSGLAGAGAPSGTGGESGPMPVRYTEIGSPGTSGAERLTREPSWCVTAPAPAALPSTENTPGAWAATEIRTGCDPSGPLKTTSVVLAPERLLNTDGATRLICPGETYRSGAGTPAICTRQSASVVGSGKPAALAVCEARLTPKMLRISPAVIGWPVANEAPFTTPPLLMVTAAVTEKETAMFTGPLEAPEVMETFAE